MRLAENEIRRIEEYLDKDRIFYDDIRMEMTDHIAASLEEQLMEGDDFDTALSAYMNSHLKVKLLTAAREQEVLRDRQNMRFVLKQFVSAKGVLLLGVITTLVFTGKLNIWIDRFFELVLMVMLISSLFLYKREGKVQPFFGHMTEITQFYYVVPCLLIMQSHRFLEQTNFLTNCELLAMSIIFTGYYLTYTSSRLLQIKKYA